ncbi:tRNA cytosine(34) acetyltransferase TmcA [Vibrio ponticus]|uniref:tRNA(Met) cytidine acetyltransferase TmcA n=1 Tax=Vibrio ponticus TaxID=265668 RepID=A0ABX3FM65_9VIBR|nr:GNAT family N-acetyltransferase [Vibrio ponticus]OLQ95037.1 tRNA cytosine(34) acetyltransferase TmcA [Vibrio ponticus]
MLSEQQFLIELQKAAQVSNHRFGLFLKGDDAWSKEFCHHAAQLNQATCFQLGGEALPFVTQFCPMNKGQQLLGHECELLIVDLSNEFDANSVTSVLGTLRGGGLAIFIHASQSQTSFANQWLLRALQHLLVVEQGSDLPVVPLCDQLSESQRDAFAMQSQAVTLIKKVVTGHRRRPVVLTADRGRGKTSALGIASAQLMLERKLKIIVTSPTIGNVSPLFEHAEKLLGSVTRSKFKLEWQGSSIEFVAPDEVVRGNLQCDLLLVDEASAIPLPMLISMVEQYHRAVFATTIHGYEGCGRGFTLKFQSWLTTNRPGTRFYHMETPIRWASNDPLESWQYQSFLLDAELDELPANIAPDKLSIVLTHYRQEELFNSPDILKQCFALLVNAHYQTTPNDLMLLLSDPAMKLFASFEGNNCVACIVGVEEGGLDRDLVQQVIAGKRRPKGHLVASSLAAHLAVNEPALDKSLRIMRIAVHPSWQNRGIGSDILSQLYQQTGYQFYSTSFGVTEELFRFWSTNGYRPIKLGIQRDQASGCHSLIMVKGEGNWIESGVDLLSQSLRYQMSELYHQLDTSLVQALVDSFTDRNHALSRFEINILENYAQGGSSYENVSMLLAKHIWHSALDESDGLLIRKVLQQWSWADCAHDFNLAGRKQVEMRIRQLLLNRIK